MIVYQLLQKMAPVGLYAALATTAGVFVGLLNAYLVSRISGLKGERRQIEQRVKSINARLEPLREHYGWREEQISEQVERRAEEQAEEDIENFIDYHVGDEWSTNPDDLNLDEIIDGLTDYLECDRSDLTEYHVEEIRDRWTDIQNELRPSSSRGMFGMGAEIPDIPVDSSTQAANYQIETQWEIYDRTLLDRRNADFASVETEINSLREERDRLSQQYSRVDPRNLVDGVKSTGWAIVLSVGVPMLTYLLHAIDLTIIIPFGNIVEPVIVFASWSVGLILTFQYVWDEVTDVEDNLPELPSDDEGRESTEGTTSQIEASEENQVRYLGYIFVFFSLLRRRLLS